MHLQDAAPFRSVHSAFEPQGDGLQGSGLSVILGGAETFPAKFKPFVHNIKFTLTCRYPLTRYKCISGIPRIACTCRDMTSDPTCSMSPTDSRARVDTVLVDTSFVPWALIVGYTLWLTLHIGVPNVVSNTLARCSSVSFRALGIHSTR